jgi:uncharacterized Zn finger protein
MPRRKANQHSWWSERWLSALDGPWEGRLSRGRSYAQGGRVHDVQIEPGLVTARVIGTRPTPYRVELRLPTVEDAAWSRIAAQLARRAANAAALLNGELPSEAETAFAAAGAALFPAPEERVAASCSCPDWVRPCKHAAALMYVIAGELDRDPFLLFAMRGRTRDELLALLRAEGRADSAAPSSDEPVPAPRDLLRTGGDFFAFDPPHQEARPSANGAVAEHNGVLKRLGQPPRSLGGAELRRELESAYELLAERAREALRADPAERRRQQRQRAEDGAAEG